MTPLVWTAATSVPWERERQERITQALCQGWVQGPQRSPSRGEDAFARFASENGLPPSAGPGAALSSSKWGELLKEARLFEVLPTIGRNLEREYVYLRGSILVTALALYQAEKGQPPQKLEDLVPAYLPALPLDPYTGQPFHYRISHGEKIEGNWPSGPGGEGTLVNGQGLVWSDGLDSSRAEDRKQSSNRYLFPVPFWKVE
jgi:hypothetical protein